MAEEYLLDEEEDGGDEGVPAWVVTFGDMMSLLLTFFILLFAFSEIDATKYKGISESLKSAFGVPTSSILPSNPKGKQLTLEETGGSSGLLPELNSVVTRSVPGATIQSTEGRGILVTIPGSLLFESGEAVLKPAMNEYLQGLAEVVKRKENRILQVEGHTDNVPIRTARYRSNWELSSARAIAVIRFLIEICKVPPKQLAAAGYADSHALVPNDSSENREKNRRVEFRFLEE